MDNMDNIDNMDLETDVTTSKQTLKLATKPTKLNTGCTLIVNSVMLIFFSVYVFDNPDTSDCYVLCDKGQYNVLNTNCTVEW